MDVWRCWHSQEWFITIWCLELQLLVVFTGHGTPSWEQISEAVPLKVKQKCELTMKWKFLRRFLQKISEQVVKGPLFPLFPEGWEGPQGAWDFLQTFLQQAV